MWAATACGQLGLTSAEPKLMGLLGHRDPMVRETACRALGRLASTAAVASLGRVLEDESEFVREAAAEALADIGGDDALERIWAAFTALRFARAGYLAAAVSRFGETVFDGSPPRPPTTIRNCGSGPLGRSAPLATSGRRRSSPASPWTTAPRGPARGSAPRRGGH